MNQMSDVTREAGGPEAWGTWMSRVCRGTKNENCSYRRYGSHLSILNLLVTGHIFLPFSKDAIRARYGFSRSLVP